jgi:hypothetical protein
VLAIVFFMFLVGLIPAARNFPFLLFAILLSAFAGLVFSVLRIEATFRENRD